MPNCSICDDTGFKTIERFEKRNTEDVGRTVTRVVRCDCRAQSQTEGLLALARIPKRYEHCELSNFDVRFEGANLKLKAAKLICEGYVQEFLSLHKSGKGLLFVGPIGTGKTHLAVGLLKELVRRYSVKAVFYDYRELLKEIQNSYNPSVEATEMQVLRPVMEAEVLVLDELGAVKPSEWVWDTVSLILNTRYNEERTTIVTTNLKDAEQRIYDEEQLRDPKSQAAAHKAASDATLGDRITNRMLSRLHEMCRDIRLDGKDFRTTVKSARKVPLAGR